MTPMNMKEVPFWEHLTELLRRVRIILLALVFSTISVMVFPISIDGRLISPSNPWYPTIASFVIQKMQEQFLPNDVTLLPLSWFAPLEVYVIVSVMLGGIISLPVIAYELYMFVNPALYDREKKTLAPFVLSFVFLFVFGFTIGYLFVVPTTVSALLIFARLLRLPAIYEFTEFFWLVVGSLLLCGLIFTFPVYLVFLVKVGILSTQIMANNRRYLYPAIIVLIAVLDPEPSLITETLIGLPTILLIEVSMRIARRYEKARQRKGQP